jgi:hypothetical protein
LNESRPIARGLKALFDMPANEPTPPRNMEKAASKRGRFSVSAGPSTRSTKTKRGRFFAGLSPRKTNPPVSATKDNAESDCDLDNDGNVSNEIEKRSMVWRSPYPTRFAAKKVRLLSLHDMSIFQHSSSNAQLMFAFFAYS